MIEVLWFDRKVSGQRPNATVFRFVKTLSEIVEIEWTCESPTHKRFWLKIINFFHGHLSKI